MNFKKFELKYFISSLLICLAYPIIKVCISNNKLLVLSDTCFVVSLIYIALGIINMSILHGDFDIQGFIAQRSILKNNDLQFKDYQKIKESERKDRFNYPLFTGIIVLLFSIIISIIV